MKKEAIISNCKKYRYVLSRIWDESKPTVMFIMLNPSTADAEVDDHTIRRCKNFAESWGYGTLHVCNLYPYRATDPTELLTAEIPEGINNATYIKETAAKSDLIVCAWGNNGIDAKVQKMILKRTNEEYKPFKGIQLANLHYLELSKTGTPKHPLYLPKDTKPKRFIIKN